MIVSLIIPFYKGNKYIPGIKSMAKNNAINLNKNQKIELIVVNDSPWIKMDYDKLEDASYTLKIITNNKNVGIQQSRVNGIKAATGDYVLMLDQDDIISNCCIKEHLRVIGNADISVSNGYRVVDNKEYKIYGSKIRQKKVKNEFWYIYLENRILSPGLCLIKKNSIPKAWCENIMNRNGADDLLLWIMMLEQDSRIVITPKYLYKHMSTGENVSNDDNLMAESTEEMLQILITQNKISRLNRWLLKRKIYNDKYYIMSGKDAYVDYKIIELIRKLIGTTR